MTRNEAKYIGCWCPSFIDSMDPDNEVYYADQTEATMMAVAMSNEFPERAVALFHYETGTAFHVKTSVIYENGVPT